MQQAVERATALIRDKYSEPLTLDDIAGAAIMSRFHFSRVFRQITGISPGRFLTAVRIHEAKRLLLTTQTSIADISCQVGYTSLGTFTTRFTEYVGVSPGRFRRLAELGLLHPIGPETHRPGTPAGALTGTVRAAGGLIAGPVFIGVFDRRIPQGKPEACLTLPAAGDWLMDAVPEGDWYVMAVTLGCGFGLHEPPSGIERPMLVAGGGPIRLRRDGLCNVDLTLHPPRPIDPPVLLTLPTLLKLRPAEERNLEEDAAV
jgi:AraC-like DNA-binding protein